MTTSPHPALLHLLSLALLLQCVLGGDSYLYQICSNSENYTSNSIYNTNLNKVMASLFRRVPPTGFGLVSVGQNHHRVYGLALCRGDVSSKDCKICIANAKTEIRKGCPNHKEAIIWYDYCLLKYSNYDFFGKIDSPKFIMVNSQNVSDPAPFNKKTKELLNKAAHEAYLSSKKYASGELVFSRSEKLYGLAQCTRDLSTAYCKECLNVALSYLPTCCDGIQGGRVVGGSCNIRYELYPFLNF
ncbi:cysteine-rich repeat secretory protein 38-like [Telopea speciosissima]|uniref:cysteine-rich repeat secretory protein 38-like n=1 Tax=Telopea speciosissima TaxID=54955 RepID=UPI001CC598C7|nr:cysteine-rich repeat secretory protein 38-like [Telopea speciosissima]